MSKTQTASEAGDTPAAAERVILASKVTRPPVRSPQLRRPAQLAALRDGAGRSLTLLAAPPGFGKTTLLAEWAEGAHDERVAWLSLDEDDNDPTRFFAYVLAALRTAEPGLGDRAVAAQGTPGARLIDVVLPLLLNDLSRMEHGIALVLDDFHLIGDEAVHEALAYLVGRMPRSLRLVIATREDPPLPLGRLRARGELAELRAAELRFSDEEAQSFLNDGLGLELSPGDVRALQARTEGWPAALYLAALSLRGRPEPSAVIEAFTGDDRHVVDYLTAEVLARQSPELRSFLLRTSILRRLCGPLCDAVADCDGSTAILADLERTNLLLVPLDTKREWYRYHALFAELLRHELTLTEPGILPGLHRRAGEWYRGAGLVVEAANHATAAGDVDAAVELVARNYSYFLSQGQLATVTRWLAALPDEAVAGDWVLCFAAAMVASHTGRLEEAEEWLAHGEAAPQIGRHGREPEGPLAALRAWIELLRGDIGGTIAAARRAVSAAPAAEPAWALAPQLLLGVGLWCSDDAAEAQTVLERVTRTAQSAGIASTTILALGIRAAIELDGGAATQADTLAGEAVELAHRAALDEHPFIAVAHVVLGRMQATRDPASAAGEIERGIQLAERVRAWHIITYGLLALAEVRHRQQNAVAARRLLTRVRTIFDALPDPGAGPARLERAEKTLHLRARRAPDTESAPYWELSAREVTVLRMLAGSLSQREIAAELYVSFNTVKTHTRTVFRKLGVTSRAEAVSKARDLGLL